MSKAEEIWNKMRDDGKRFYACDNISEYVTEEDKNVLIKEATEKFEGVLKTLLIDTEQDPNSQETAKRLAKMYILEIMEGRYTDPPTVTGFPNEGEDRYDGMLVVRAEIKSVCSHHWQPVQGVAYIGILPSDCVLGLSKYIRVAQHLARRGTLQEQLCVNIRKEISKLTDTPNVAVYIEGTHGCCENRGVGVFNSTTQTISLGGKFLNDPMNKEEFFNNIKLQKMK